MSDKDNMDEVPVEVISDDESDNSIEEITSSETSLEELKELLDLEKKKATDYEEKLKHVLADFQNLNRKSRE